MAKNVFGALVAGGIAAMLAFQIFVNVGMTIGIMPITGVPLPLMSYGGSSVIVTFMAIGVLQSIHVQARMTRRQGPRPDFHGSQLLKKQVFVTVDRGETRVGILEAEGDLRSG